jgi:hypothetical protein
MLLHDQKWCTKWFLHPGLDGFVSAKQTTESWFLETNPTRNIQEFEIPRSICG